MYFIYCRDGHVSKSVSFAIKVFHQQFPKLLGLHSMLVLSQARNAIQPGPSGVQISIQEAISGLLQQLLSIHLVKLKFMIHCTRP